LRLRLDQAAQLLHILADYIQSHTAARDRADLPGCGQAGTENEVQRFRLVESGCFLLREHTALDGRLPHSLQVYAPAVIAHLHHEAVPSLLGP